MNKKAAIELSVNFLVILMLTLVIFGFSIKFIFDLFGGAGGLADKKQADLDKLIGDVQCGTKKTCITPSSQTINRGDFDIFGLKITHIYDNPSDYYIKIGCKKGYDEDKNEIPCTSDSFVLLPEDMTISLQKNQEKSTGIGIEVAKNTPSGRYIFDVSITRDSTTTESKQIYVTVP
ncbi:hypothetical protein KY330_04820 [Candidatus Woesearchaeota archaeon]|nr:hypothetical protein [Candidatus Woesearchaeota archaeon]